MTSNSSRRRFLQSAGVVGIAGLAGCIEGTDSEGDGDSGGGDGDGGNGGGSTDLAWHAGGTGGTYYPLSNEFKTVVDANTDYSLTVQSTGASVENVGSLASGDADFALIQNDIAYFAKNGTGLDTFEGEAIDSLRGVATLYPETITIVTQGDSGIETLEDMEGARINTGDLGSGTQVNALQILSAVGIEEGDFEEENSDFESASDQVRNGDVDAAFVVGGWPVGAIEELAQTSDINIVEVSGDTREGVKEQAQWFADDTIPAGTYEGVDEDVETVSVQAMIATHEGVDEEVVENVTAAIFDNVDGLNIKTDFISTDTAQDGMSIELHAGADAYFG